MGVTASRDSLLDRYDSQQRQIAELQNQIPVIMTKDDPNIMLLNFNSDQRELFNKVIRHAAKIGGIKLTNDIAALWYAFELYDTLLISPQTAIQKEISLKRVAGILTRSGMATSRKPEDQRDESEYGVLDLMVEDISRGINVAGGQLWHTKVKGCQ